MKDDLPKQVHKPIGTGLVLEKMGNIVQIRVVNIMLWKLPSPKSKRILSALMNK